MDPPRAPRRGRPLMEQTYDEVADKPTNQRVRMRIAQRAYRDRQRMALSHEKARVEKLTIALNRALGAFNRFHHQILQPRREQLPADVLSHLSQIAMEMSLIVEDTRVDIGALGPSSPLSQSSTKESEESRLLDSGQPRTMWEGHRSNLSNQSSRSMLGPLEHQSSVSKQPTVSLLPWTKDPSHNPITSRIFRACLEHGISLLANQLDHERPETALIIPLQMLGKELLMARSLKSLSIFSGDVTDCYYAEQTAQQPPRIYRVIEGDSDIVPRQPSPLVQRLQFGKTRTVLHTEIPELQGEWLEALDVEEYLEERGIHLRSYGSFHGRIPQEGNTISSSWNVSQYQQPAKSGRSKLSIIDRVAKYQYHEGADMSVFGIKGPLSSSILPGANFTHAAGLRQVSATALQQPSMPKFQTHPTQGSSPTKIVVDVDELVRTLAANATCLGPVPGIRREAVDHAIRQSIMSFEEVAEDPSQV